MIRIIFFKAVVGLTLYKIFSILSFFTRIYRFGRLKIKDYAYHTIIFSLKSNLSFDFKIKRVFTERNNFIF